MANGWIRLSRRLLDWQWHDDPNMVALWVYILLRANYEPTTYHGQTIEAGQFVTTLPKLSADTGLSIMQVRRCLRLLTDCGAIQTTIRYTTVISIANYAQYQSTNLTSFTTDISPRTNNSKSNCYVASQAQRQQEFNRCATDVSTGDQHKFHPTQTAHSQTVAPHPKNDGNRSLTRVSTDPI